MESLGFSLWVEEIKLMILCTLHIALAHTPLHFLMGWVLGHWGLWWYVQKLQEEYRMCEIQS